MKITIIKASYIVALSAMIGTGMGLIIGTGLRTAYDAVQHEIEKHKELKRLGLE